MSDLFSPPPAEPKELYFIIPGEVRGKGRPRFRVIKPKAGGEFVSTYTDAGTKKYEATIATYAAMAKAGAKWRMVGFPDDKDPDPVSLRLDVVALILIPVSRTKKLRAALDGKMAINRIDGDNIIKSCLDAMQNIIFEDDKVVTVMTVTKIWTADATKQCLKVKVSTCV